MKTVSYPYRPKVGGPMACGVIMLIALALFARHVVKTNNSELILGGIIHIQEYRVAEIFNALTHLSAIAAVLLLVALAKHVFSGHRVTLSATMLSLPNFMYGFALGTSQLMVSDIRVALMLAERKRRRICLLHASGTFSIYEQYLPDGRALDALYEGFGNRRLPEAAPVAPAEPPDAQALWEKTASFLDILNAKANAAEVRAWINANHRRYGFYSEYPRGHGFLGQLTLAMSQCKHAEHLQSDIMKIEEYWNTKGDMPVL